MLINGDRSISVMINEEDHLRETVYTQRACTCAEAYERLSEIDGKINRSIKFAYDEQLGYLTACPTNLGTGLRASVMLFLPAITINGAMREVVRIISRLGLTVRGIYGEGSEAEGYMYQVSNEVTLGVTEDEIIAQVEEVARKICQLEGAEREKLLHGKLGLAVKDKCMRALRYCRQLRNTHLGRACLACRRHKAGRLPRVLLDAVARRARRHSLAHAAVQHTLRRGRPAHRGRT